MRNYREIQIALCTGISIFYTHVAINIFNSPTVHPTVLPIFSLIFRLEISSRVIHYTVY